jgi:hypothetical protein
VTLINGSRDVEIFLMLDEMAAGPWIFKNPRLLNHFEGSSTANR